MAPSDTTTTEAQPADLLPGLPGIAADWASDQRAFKNVPWGKAMMWIFLLSDTFIFSCFLISYMVVRMAMRISGIGSPPNDNAKTSLGMGQGTVVDILTTM